MGWRVKPIYNYRNHREKVMTIKTHRRWYIIALIAATAAAPMAMLALPVEQIPDLRQTERNWVSDTANILRPETEKKLNVIINHLHSFNGSEMVVVSVPESKPATSPKELATKLFNRWGIGQKGKDNGILFLISVADRRVEIETGYGLEAILPDAKLGQLIEQRIKPKFKAGDFDAGTLSGSEAIVQLVEAKGGEFTPAARRVGPVDPIFYLIFAYSSIWFFVAVAESTRSKSMFMNGVYNLMALAGWVFVRGLGQSVKLNPSQSSRVNSWRLRFETDGAMRCAICGEVLDLVDNGAMEAILKPSQKAAATLGSLQFRGWRCRRCAPETMHLRNYKSMSSSFDFCPHCQELTVVKEPPYVTRNPSFLGRDLRFTNSHCVNCDYTNRRQEFIPYWKGFVSSSSGGGSSDAGSSGGSSDSGGSSGGGGAGGSW
jgi:uncharacterized protein